MNMTKRDDCPICGSTKITHEKNLLKKYLYCGETYVVENNESLKCSGCGVLLYGDGMIERNNQRFFELEKQVIPDGVSPRKIYGLREIHLISVCAASKIFNCSVSEWESWENSESSPPQSVRDELRLAIES